MTKTKNKESKLSNIDPRFAQTDYRVEATSFERLYLYEQYASKLHPDEKISWDEETKGTIINVGVIDNRPVCICCFWVIINKRRVLFWEATSEIVDYKMIEEWFDNNCDPMIDSCDVSNFHPNLLEK